MTTIRSTLSYLALCGLLLADGCAQVGRANAASAAPAEGPLSATLQEAEREAAAMRFGVADRLLANFAEEHRGAPESVEAGFWRALLKLDPANQTGGPREAITLLDAYLGAPQGVAHRGTAISLRRVALVLDRPPTVVAASAAPAQAAPSAKPESKPDQSSADEVQRLKDELAKANAELERIKRRVAQPNP